MLTNDSANRLDAINEAMSLVVLLDNLMGARAPGADLTLSSEGASGLSLMLSHVRDTLNDASTGLRKAGTDYTAALAVIDHSSDAHRRGYTQGYADASHEQAPTAVPGDAYLSGLRAGANVAYGAGWRDAGGDIRSVRQDWRKETVEALIESALEERAEAAPAPDVAPMPVLTEAVPQEEREAVAHDGQRQHA